MNIYTGLLFNQGHVQDPALARSLAQAPAAADHDDPAAGEDASPAADPALPRVRRQRGWVELQAALLSAFR